MRDKYGVGGNPACYPGTDVLINRLDLRDPDLLAAAEAEPVDRDEWVAACICAVGCDSEPLSTLLDRCIGRPIAETR